MSRIKETTQCVVQQFILQRQHETPKITFGKNKKVFTCSDLWSLHQKITSSLEGFLSDALLSKMDYKL